MGSSRVLLDHKPLIILECLTHENLEEIEKYLEKFQYGAGIPLDGIRHTREMQALTQNSTIARNYCFRPL
jgi:hypothetical protein